MLDRVTPEGGLKPRRTPADAPSMFFVSSVFIFASLFGLAFTRRGD